MANQVPISSLIGANLSSSDTTALFALGTTINTNDGGRFQYVAATSTLVTGELVLLNPTSTAFALTTAALTASANGINIGAAQNIINQGEFGWFATQGRNLYILCTGTCTAGAELGFGFSANSGRIQNALVVGVGATCLGLFITTSASTATASAAVGTLEWPRPVSQLA